MKRKPLRMVMGHGKLHGKPRGWIECTSHPNPLLLFYSAQAGSKEPLAAGERHVSQENFFRLGQMVSKKQCLGG